MRTAFVVYGLLYVATEVVGHQIEQVGWPQLTALDVATACAQAALAVALLVALLVGTDIAAHRWRRRQRERALAELAEWAEPAPIVVRSWRPDTSLTEFLRT
jgi:hypothetical protein